LNLGCDVIFINQGGNCAERIVCAMIISKNKKYIAYNTCKNPVSICPRMFGEGYEKCKSICKQDNHAEINAINLAGKDAYGSIMIIYGHDYACQNCIDACKKAGISKIIISPIKKRFKCLQ